MDSLENASMRSPLSQVRWTQDSAFGSWQTMDSFLTTWRIASRKSMTFFVIHMDLENLCAAPVACFRSYVPDFLSGAHCSERGKKVVWKPQSLVLHPKRQVVGSRTIEASKKTCGTSTWPERAQIRQRRRASNEKVPQQCGRSFDHS